MVWENKHRRTEPMPEQNNALAAMQGDEQGHEGLILTKLDQAINWARG